MKKTLLSSAVLAAISFGLTACGGGGSDTGSKPEPDTTAPVISINGGDVQINQGSLYFDAGASAEDDVDGEVTVTTTNTVDTSTVGIHTVTYTAVDAAGNEATATRTVTVMDVTAPTITVIGGKATIREGETYIDAGVVASDAVDGDLSVTASHVDTSTAGIKKIIFTATDSAGNTTTAERTVQVIRNAAFNVFDGTWRTACVTTDQLPGNTSSAIQEFSLAGDKMISTVTAFSSVDCSGTPVYEADAEADLIFGGQIATGTCQAERVDADITSVEVNGNVLDRSVIQQFVTQTKYPVYNLFCITEDGALVGGDTFGEYDGTSEEKRPIELDSSGQANFAKVDTIVPEITLIGHSEVTIPVGTTYVDAGATAVDDQDGALEVTVEGAVDTSTADTYQLVYTATDKEGNQTEAKRTVNVVRKAGSFTTFDGLWKTECTKNDRASLAAVGIRAYTKTYSIEKDSIVSTLKGYEEANCSGDFDHIEYLIGTVVYRGEAEQFSCEGGKAEKIDYQINSARFNNDPILVSDELENYLNTTQYPSYNLICFDSDGDLREGDVTEEFNGLKESKRPIEMDMTGSGMEKTHWTQEL